MSQASVTVFMTQLRCRRRRVFALILLAFWLLLNAQLAVASHSCSLRVADLPAMLQHTDRMLHDTGMTAPQGQAADSGPVCDKHCVPDSAQKDIQHAPVVALPVETDLILADWRDRPCVMDAASLTPPIVGPPAEIQFCRYRE